MSENAGEAFVNMVNCQSSDLSLEVADHVLGLSNMWAMADATEEENARAKALANILREQFPDKFESLVKYWSGEALSELSESCLTWLADNLATFEASERQAIVDSISGEADDSSEEGISKYAKFMAALAANALDTQEVRGHLTSVVQRMKDAVPLQSSQSNPQFASQAETGRELLISLLPIVAPKLQYADDKAAVEMLQRVFGDATNITTAPEDFADLHKSMAKHWGVSNELDLDAGTVVDTAYKCIKNNPDEPATVEILTSIVRLVQSTNLESERYGASLASAAAVVWKHNLERVSHLMDHIPMAPAPDEIKVAALSLESYGESMAPVIKAFEWWSEQLSVEDQATVILSLLGAIEEDSPAEVLIRAWLEATPDSGEVVLEIIGNTDVADEGLARLWLQVCQLAPGFGLEFFQQALVELLGTTDLERTHEVIVNNREAISGLARGDGQASMNSLAGSLVDVYRKRAAGATVRGNLLQWIRELRADEKLREHGREAFEDKELEQIKSELGNIWDRRRRRN
jgi:hypothetical protein